MVTSVASAEDAATHIYGCPKSGGQEARTTKGAAKRAVAALGRKRRGGQGF